ncbi:hypothetical protein ZIOFF_031357 [Zingiber officinale]|uniref:Uncharacterized protein n=1 Tax=Zingiber officinale TaxID=94328 RepID=A0A8J5GEM5_ZINOF|nr:hypothetical protein ZIOFF_031357 [Zingiber officinale]
MPTRFYHLAPDGTNKEGQGAAKKSRMGNKATSQHQEHAIAESKTRRGSMDKASVLGDTIRYLKQLQEKIKALEDQVAKRRVESAVLLNKPDDVDVRGQSDETLPEIEASVPEDHPDQDTLREPEGNSGESSF